MSVRPMCERDISVYSLHCTVWSEPESDCGQRQCGVMNSGVVNECLIAGATAVCRLADIAHTLSMTDSVAAQ